jgi:adenine-specific DNA-methyltransferase
MSTDHPALSSGLITYIGNKRSLISFIARGMDRIEAEIGSLRTMADPFAGSGVVGRLGRLRGYRVVSGDLEEYARPFGRAFLEVQPDEVDAIFDGTGGYLSTLKYLNGLTEPSRPEDHLFSRHYAPAETTTADPERERLFYTRENALRIDAVLAAVHRDLPLSETGRDILLASLLVEMSIHNNTSGVMKGFHHGWGGRGGDALSRIMAPVHLEALPFIEGPRGYAWTGPADKLFSAGPERDILRFDLVYADPPYNIHQYGANYHLLTTAVRWDFYDPGPVLPGARAGIRRDHRRSAFCSRRNGTARDAMERFLQAASTRSLLVSYNNDGIIDAPTMVELLSEDGINTVELLVQEHHKFRGGKATQSALKTDEYLFLVFRGRRQSSRDRQKLRGFVDELALRRELHDRFLLPSRWESQGGRAVTAGQEGTLKLTTPGGSSIGISPDFRVDSVEISSPSESTRAERETLTLMSRGASGTIIEVVEELVDTGQFDRAVVLLQRLKIKKYRHAFLRLSRRLAAENLPEGTRTRLEGLVARVVGSTASTAGGGQNGPEDPPRSRR